MKNTLHKVHRLCAHHESNSLNVNSYNSDKSLGPNAAVRHFMSNIYFCTVTLR
jgi:hypothetical protein